MHDVKSAAAVLADDVICQSFIQSSSTLAYACLLIRRAQIRPGLPCAPQPGSQAGFALQGHGLLPAGPDRHRDRRARCRQDAAWSRGCTSIPTTWSRFPCWSPASTSNSRNGKRSAPRRPDAASQAVAYDGHTGSVRRLGLPRVPCRSGSGNAQAAYAAASLPRRLSGSGPVHRGFPGRRSPATRLRPVPLGAPVRAVPAHSRPSNRPPVPPSGTARARRATPGATPPPLAPHAPPTGAAQDTDFGLFQGPGQRRQHPGHRPLESRKRPVQIRLPQRRAWNPWWPCCPTKLPAPDPVRLHRAGRAGS